LRICGCLRVACDDSGGTAKTEGPNDGKASGAGRSNRPGDLKSEKQQKKGEGNSKCGNKYLAWAFVEAAHFAVRYNPRIKRFYERKAAKTNKIVATKAVAHKLARAAYHVMRERVPFDETRAFA